MPETLVQGLRRQMTLPVIGSPMFIVSNPELVIAQCLAGVVGSMPALNARPQSLLDEWLHEITTALSTARSRSPDAVIAPYAINQIVHQSNTRLADDMAVCAKYKVPLIITSLRAPGEVVQSVHQWGGKVFHDVISLRHAEKALEAGVDGLILVASGAGGHAGTLSPFALVSEVRRIFKGPIVLSGAITTGSDILAARAMGADFAYMGTRFIASQEANATDAYKRMLVQAHAADIVYTPYFTGIPGNYLKGSIEAAGYDPANLPPAKDAGSQLGSALTAKAWKDVWGAGQGVGSIDSIEPAARIVERLQSEYEAARTALLEETYA